MRDKSTSEQTDDPGGPADIDADPRTTSVIAGTRLDLLDALEDLGAERPELARAVLLRDVAAVDYAEIARLLDVPVGTAKSHIHNARRWLRPRLSASD